MRMSDLSRQVWFKPTDSSGSFAVLEVEKKSSNRSKEGKKCLTFKVQLLFGSESKGTLSGSKNVCSESLLLLAAVLQMSAHLHRSVQAGDTPVYAGMLMTWEQEGGAGGHHMVT